MIFSQGPHLPLLPRRFPYCYYGATIAYPRAHAQLLVSFLASAERSQTSKFLELQDRKRTGMCTVVTSGKSNDFKCYYLLEAWHADIVSCLSCCGVIAELVCLFGCLVGRAVFLVGWFTWVCPADASYEEAV